MIIRRHTLILLACLATATPIAVALAWLTRDPVSQIQNVVTPTVVPGRDLVIESEVFRHRLCATKVERTLYDGRGIRFVMQDIDFASAPGPLGREKYAQTIPVPATAAPGAAYVNIGLVWHCAGSWLMGPQKTIIGPLHFTISPP